MGDILRKGLTIFSFFIIIIIVFSQLLLPTLAEKTAQTHLMTRTKAESASVSLHTTPFVLLLLGQVDTVNMKAENAMLGQVRVQELELRGENMRVDLSALDSTDGSAVKRADKLELRGVVSADALRELLQKKVERLQNVEVTIEPETIRVTAQAKIAGRMADINLEGRVLGENGGIYFRMTKLDIKNAILGKAVIGNFFGDILLVNLNQLPFRTELDDVVQKDGQVEITASRHSKD